MIVLFLPWLSLLLSLRAMLGTRVRLKGADQVPVGGSGTVQAELRCPVPLPPHRCRILVTQANTGQHWVLRDGDSLPTEHCGGLVCTVYRGKVYDYLGLFGMKIRRTEPRRVRVMPIPREVRIPADLTRMLGQTWKAKVGGGFGEQYEIRPYREGDPLNLVHWKLTEKVDSLMVREPMVPDGGRIRLCLSLCGSPDELDRKLGRLLWLGNRLLSENVPFEVAALTGNGLEIRTVDSDSEWLLCMDTLLFAPLASEEWGGNTAPWQISLGGEPDEE